MAQSKVTEYFASRKRKPDSHPSKRQKLSDPSLKLTHGEGSTNHVESSLHKTIRLKSKEETDGKVDEVVSCPKEPLVAETKTSRKTQKLATTRTRSSRRISSKNKTDAKQMSLTDSFLLTQTKSAIPKLAESTVQPNKISIPTQSSFDFKLTTLLPSDCDSAVTMCSQPASPHSTPTKRVSSNKPSKSVPAKRKRKTELTDTTITPTTTTTILDSSETCNTLLTGRVRKKLEMPVITESEPTQPNPQSSQKELISTQDNQEKVTKPASVDAATQKAAAKSVDGKEDQSRNKISASQMKDMLSKCGKLEDLKAALHKVQGITKELKEKKTRKTRTETVNPVVVSADTSVARPAYEKYKDLALKIPPTLTLPYKYKLLENMFRGTDTVISIMHNRLERVTFNKLKQAVQDMIRRNFEPKHLGQIKTVYPESYDLRLEKGLVETGKRNSKYQLTVEANITDNEENSKVISKRKDGRPVFSSTQVVKRKEAFRSKLFDIVKSHHQKFVEALSPPLHIDNDKITRWHPKFLLDEVPDIQPVELPQAPEECRQLVTARDVLDSGRGKLPSRVEKALQKVAEATEAAKNLKEKTAPCDNPAKESSVDKPSSVKQTVSKDKSSAATSGISSSLLDRIRAKEALKQKADMLRDENTDKELQILSRLPEMINILRSYFITERKAALTEDSVIVKLCDSYKTSISQSSVEKHIEYMLKILPEWITRISISSGTFIKINRQTELSVLNTKVNKIYKQKQYVLPAQ